MVRSCFFLVEWVLYPACLLADSGLTTQKMKREMSPESYLNEKTGSISLAPHLWFFFSCGALHAIPLPMLFLGRDCFLLSSCWSRPESSCIGMGIVRSVKARRHVSSFLFLSPPGLRFSSYMYFIGGWHVNFSSSGSNRL